MQAMMVVILHVATQLLAELGDRVKRPAVDDVSFERVNERFHVRVLARCAAARHAVPDALGNQPGAKRRAEKLAAAVAIEDQPSCRAPATECRIDHGAGAPRIADAAQPPRQNATRVLIQHRG